MWGVCSVGCVQCGVCTVWGVYSVGCVQCGVCTVWGMCSVGHVQFDVVLHMATSKCSFTVHASCGHCWKCVLNFSDNVRPCSCFHVMLSNAAPPSLFWMFSANFQGGFLLESLHHPECFVHLYTLYVYQCCQDLPFPPAMV